MRSIFNVPVVDLRKFKRASELKEIEKIFSCAMVIFPADTDEEMREVISNISISDVAHVEYLKDDVEVAVRNGACFLTPHDFKEDGKTYIVVNGVCVISRQAAGAHGKLAVNGVLITPEDTELETVLVNGVRYFREADNALFYENKIFITKQLLYYLKPNTVIISGNKLIMDKDITDEDLEKCTATFVSSNKIVCTQEQYYYLVVHAIAGNKIVVDDSACEIN